jgi:biotin carboxyl carrier protein
MLGSGGSVVLKISSGEEKTHIEVVTSAGKWKVRVDNKEVSCDWVRLPGGEYSLIHDGRVFDLLVDLDNDSCSVAGRAGAYSFRITDPRRLSAQQVVEEGRAGLQRLYAEMPGKVVRILAKEGDLVTYDQGLLVIEAMKMQNEIRSPKSGTIKEIGVNDGKAVNTGDFLLSIE